MPEVAFEDNGRGISAEDLGTIGQPYKTTKESGSGLGLMIVHRIMRDHGGEMEIFEAHQIAAHRLFCFPARRCASAFFKNEMRKLNEACFVDC